MSKNRYNRTLGTLFIENENVNEYKLKVGGCDIYEQQPEGINDYKHTGESSSFFVCRIIMYFNRFFNDGHKGRNKGENNEFN